MEVILKKDVDNLGFFLELVNVKPGYGRNYLIPKGLAELATPSAKEKLQKALQEREEVEKEIVAAAHSTIKQLKHIELKISAKAGEKNKIFGSINNADLSDALKSKGVNIDKKHIKIPGNTIKTLGTQIAKIKLHRSIEVDFSFEVVAEDTEK